MKAYEKQLNSASPPQGDDQWTIGGVLRQNYMWKNQYGTALRRHDPIAFRVGYNIWKRSG